MFLMLSYWMSAICFAVFFLILYVSSLLITLLLKIVFSRRLFNDFLRKLFSYFFENLGISRQANYLWFGINQFLKVFVNPFKLFVKALIVVFAFLFILLKHCQDFIKVEISRWGNVVTLSGSCVFIERHDEG